METATMEEQDVTTAEDSPVVTDNPPTVAPEEAPAEAPSEDKPAEEDPTVVTSPESPSTENHANPSEFAGAILNNGSEIDADTVMKCGTCGAQFYARDAAEDGSCPAVNSATGEVCGGTLGPISA